MHLVMFDVDGTLVESTGFDTECFVQSIESVLNISVERDWSRYRHVTDRGILDEIISKFGLVEQKGSMRDTVKADFIARIAEHIAQNEIRQVAGAADFIACLREKDDVVLSIATGGWKETTILKLNAAGINVSGIPIASASDHYDRTEIMKIAEKLADTRHIKSRTYFGDGVWDKEASALLGYNFVLVGCRTEHSQQICDFRQADKALRFIGV